MDAHPARKSAPPYQALNTMFLPPSGAAALASASFCPSGIQLLHRTMKFPSKPAVASVLISSINWSTVNLRGESIYQNIRAYSVVSVERLCSTCVHLSGFSPTKSARAFSHSNMSSVTEQPATPPANSTTTERRMSRQIDGPQICRPFNLGFSSDANHHHDGPVDHLTLVVIITEGRASLVTHN